MIVANGLRPLSLVVLLGILACATDDGVRPPTVTVTDSAGVRLVHNTGSDRELKVREITRFGLVDGDPDLLFDQIRSVALDSGGGIWVSDSHSSVRRYSFDGRYLGAVGGEGQGPGESARGYGDIWAADSTLYATSYSGTHQLFSYDGRFLGSRPGYAGGSYVEPLGPSSLGWLFRATTYPDPGEPAARQAWTVHHGPATADSSTRVASFRGEPVVSSGPGRWAGGSFFEGYPSLAADATGRLYYSDPMEYRVDVYSPTGELASRIRREVDRQPYPSGIDAELERGMRDGWRSLSPVVDERRVRLMVDGALPDTDPDWLPAIDLVLVGANGALWVRRADLHPRPAMQAVAMAYGYLPQIWLPEWKADWAFDLIDPEGRYQGSLTLPLEFTPMAVSGDTVYGSWRDELDVEYLVAFEAVPVR